MSYTGETETANLTSGVECAESEDEKKRVYHFLANTNRNLKRSSQLYKPLNAISYNIDRVEREVMGESTEKNEDNC